VVLAPNQPNQASCHRVADRLAQRTAHSGASNIARKPAWRTTPNHRIIPTAAAHPLFSDHFEAIHRQVAHVAVTLTVSFALAACFTGRVREERVVPMLSIAPDIVSTASDILQNSGSELRSATAAAASQTTAIAAPAADEVSAAITSLFAARAQEFQTLSARAAAFHDEFVNLLSGGAAQYVTTEAANVQQMFLPGGAAANPADVPVTTSAQTYFLGPLALSLNQTAFPSHDGTATSAFYGGSVSFNTPFGSFPLTSFQGRSFSVTGGPFAENLYFNTSFGRTGAEIAGTTILPGLQLPTTLRSVTVGGVTLGAPPNF
jgi:hypothetical protein